MRWPFLRSSAPKVLGHVEIFDGRILRGWAWDQRAASSRLCLDVFVRGTFAGTARTGRFRPDLADNGIGDGRHAFTFHVPDLWREADLRAEEIAVFPAGADLPRLGWIGSDGVAEAGPSDQFTRTPKAYFAPLVRLIAVAQTNGGGSPLPLAGRGRGSGRASHLIEKDTATPHPLPLPARGRGG